MKEGNFENFSLGLDNYSSLGARVILKFDKDK